MKKKSMMTKPVATTKPRPSTIRTPANMDAAQAEALRILSEAVGKAVEVLAGCPSFSTATKANPLHDENALTTEEEVRAALNLPNVHAVRELRHKRRIPFISLGYRTIRYSIPDCIRALKKAREIKALPV